MSHSGWVPISQSRHGSCFWRRFTRYDFARTRSEVPIVSAEIGPCAAACPTAFRQAKGQVYPVALLSLRAGQDTPFVSAEGRWLGTYVPSALRAHPFAVRATEDPAQMTLLVDEDSGLITRDPHDQPFYSAEGQISPDLAQVLTFFRNRAAAEQATAAHCALLRQMDLFVPLDSCAGIALPPGLLTVDQARLAALRDAQIVLLMRSQALALAHAHHLSLEHCPWLHRAGFQKATPLTDTTLPGNTPLDGFLSALAQAHENNTLPGQPGEESICLQATPAQPGQGLRA